MYQSSLDRSRPAPSAYLAAICSALRNPLAGLIAGMTPSLTAGEPVVDGEQPDVRQWVAQGGHLPVDDGGDAAHVGSVDDVGQPVVAVHDRGRALRGHGRGEALHQLVELGSRGRL